MEYLNIN